MNNMNNIPQVKVGTFKRSMTVPNDIDADHITAEYTDGVLKLVLPKQKVPEEKSTKININ